MRLERAQILWRATKQEALCVGTPDSWDTFKHLRKEAGVVTKERINGDQAGDKNREAGCHSQWKHQWPLSCFLRATPGCSCQAGAWFLTDGTAKSLNRKTEWSYSDTRLNLSEWFFFKRAFNLTFKGPLPFISWLWANSLLSSNFTASDQWCGLVYTYSIHLPPNRQRNLRPCNSNILFYTFKQRGFKFIPTKCHRELWDVYLPGTTENSHKRLMCNLTYT